jgi:hypothetical protein
MNLESKIKSFGEFEKVAAFGEIIERVYYAYF